MADIAASNWNEADASNSTAAPDGAPEGMFPSGVNDTMRAMMGATKRWYDQTIPLVTGGTSTAYTLSYAVVPTALADGQTHLVQFNAVNGAAPTLNVNALGAKPLHFYAGGAWGAFPANMVAVDQIVRVTYNAAAGTYRAIDTPMILNQSVSGVTAIDFTGIPANVNVLEIIFDLTVGTNAAGLNMQFFNSGASIDAGSSSYTTVAVQVGSDGTIASNLSGLTSGITLATSVSNGTVAVSGDGIIKNIQGVKGTQVDFSSNYVSSAGGNPIISLKGCARRIANGPITGIRFLPTSGTVSGVVTVRAK